MIKISPEQASKAYDILVEHAGANPDEFEKRAFVLHVSAGYCDKDDGQCDGREGFFGRSGFLTRPVEGKTGYSWYFGADNRPKRDYPEQIAQFHHKIPCDEYRFGGLLGFGGKFRNNSNNSHFGGCPYVDCYQEHLNEERREIIERTNKALGELFLKT